MPQTSTELESGHTNLTLKYKKNSRVMELDLPLPTNHPTYSQSRGEELAAQSVGGRIKVFGAQEDTSGGQLDHIKLSGGSQPISPDVKYFAATISNGAIHMTPVDKFESIKPALKYLDDTDAKTRITAKKLDVESAAGPSQLRAVQVQFKKRETEEQIAARLSSYAYLQRQIDDEAWIKVNHFLANTGETSVIAERLLSPTDAPIEFQQ